MKLLNINKYLMSLLISVLIIPGILAKENTGIFLISPAVGRINSDIQYTSPGVNGIKTLSDCGPLCALMMIYANPQYTLGSMGHFSKLDKSTENGYMFYGVYSFLKDSDIHPVAGFYADYINVFTKAASADVSPLVSLNVNTSIWALHPIAGLSFKLGKQKVMPFVGYFNEQVDTSLSSEGMLVGGQKRNGFTASSSVVQDYTSAGIKAELIFLHFMRFDTKFYCRFKNGEQPLFTARNRLDVFLSKSSGISLKYDYFDDKYEKNTFLLIGPVFIF